MLPFTQDHSLLAAVLIGQVAVCGATSAAGWTVSRIVTHSPNIQDATGMLGTEGSPESARNDARVARIVESTKVTLGVSPPSSLVADAESAPRENPYLSSLLTACPAIPRASWTLANLAWSFIRCRSFPSVSQSQIVPPRGCILWGASRSGKSRLAKALVHAVKSAHGSSHSAVAFFDLAKIVADEGSPAPALHRLLASVRNVKGLVVLDNADALIVSSGGYSRNDPSNSLLAVLLDAIDDSRFENVYFIAISPLPPTSLPQSLVRLGRLHERVELPALDEQGRTAALMDALAYLPSDLLPTHLHNRIASYASRRTRGFVAGDLVACVGRAATRVSGIRKDAPAIDEREIWLRVIDDAISDARPALLAGAAEGLTVNVPEGGWDKLFGIDDVRDQIESSVLLPLLYPTPHLPPPTGLLISGPPGTGKTLLAATIARSTGWHSVVLDGAGVMGRVVGEAEARVKKVFEGVAGGGWVVIMDQLDVIAPRRGGSESGTSGVSERVVAALVAELDMVAERSRKSAGQGVIVIATTSRPSAVDPALLRPGRFDHHVQLQAPNIEARLAILKGNLAGIPADVSEADMFDVACKCNGFSGADIENVVREAAMACLREDLENGKITTRHLWRTDPSLSPFIINLALIPTPIFRPQRGDKNPPVDHNFSVLKENMYPSALDVAFSATGSAYYGDLLISQGMSCDDALVQILLQATRNFEAIWSKMQRNGNNRMSTVDIIELIEMNTANVADMRAGTWKSDIELTAVSEVYAHIHARDAMLTQGIDCTSSVVLLQSTTAHSSLSSSPKMIRRSTTLPSRLSSHAPSPTSIENLHPSILKTVKKD
ncbi:hypothetical protein HDU93_000070 [Gonapodya sp. JEL0774]|nr:hypothetical protein HDU93_000070 [Gonapodya sp. JEL0774]